MSTDYYLADHETRTLFELGKGGEKRQVVGSDGRVMCIEELRAALQDIGGVFDDATYRDEVALKIICWAKARRIEVVEDGDDSFHNLCVGAGYEIVGSIYSNFDVVATKQHWDDCRRNKP